MGKEIDFSVLMAMGSTLNTLGSRIGRDVTIRQLHILCTVAAAGSAGIDAAKLGEATDSSSSTISRNIRILGALHYDKQRPGLGLVSVELDPSDNRRRIVRVTKSGMELVRTLVSALS